MSIRFVSTSILESEDGVDFGKETASKALEGAGKRNQQLSGGGSSLYDQLAAQNDAKQEDFEKNGKHAPTSTLDQDDVDFFNDAETKDRNAYRVRVGEDNEEVANFMKKRRDADQEQKDATKSILTKRKSTSSGSQRDSSSKGRISLISIAPVKKVRKSESCKEDGNSVMSDTLKNDAVAALLSGYDSDSE